MMELEPVEAVPGLHIIKVPFTKTAHGAVHRLDVSRLCEYLGVWELFDLLVEYPEVNRFHSVIPPRAFSHARAILPGVGKWLALAWNGREQPALLNLRPVEGLLVPTGIYIGLQSLERNRTSYTVFTHRETRIEAELDPAVKTLSSLWDQTAADPAWNEVTGAKLQPPA